MPRRVASSRSKAESEDVKVEETEDLSTKSALSLRRKLRDFTFTTEEAGKPAVRAKNESEEIVNATKKRKRSASPNGVVSTTISKASPKKAKVYKMGLDKPHPAPVNWRVTYHAIEEMRKEKNAPVDTMGCEMPMLDSRMDQKKRRFITLVSLMLSSQTKDEVTHAAIQKLRAVFKPEEADPKEEYFTLDAILTAPVTVIEECINKVGFWRRKSQYIKATAEILQKEHGGDIPRSIEGLCALPGVGMKMAMLAMQVAWGDNVGIGVDVHVHRITNRLGWHQKETKNPEETRLNLESWLPKEYHPTINPLLVGFGQMICQPVRTKCDECLLSRNTFELDLDGELQVIKGPLCPSAFKASGSPRKKKSKKWDVDDDTDEELAQIKVEVES